MGRGQGERPLALSAQLRITLASRTPSHSYFLSNIQHVFVFPFILLVSTLRGSSQQTLAEKGCQIQFAWKSLESSNAMEGPKS